MSLAVGGTVPAAAEPRAARGEGGGTLWALTAYFNPVRYRRRRANYRAFRERLTVPLVTVELAHDSAFELSEQDADVLVQLRGGDVMWQKERLLNVALRALPASCREVVWMDCDVVFEAEDWPERVSRLLERSTLVQAFSRVDHLARDDGRGGVLYSQPSAALAIASGLRGPNRFGRPTLQGPGSTNNGLAWAARRNLLEEVGLYDACIVGGGDLAMVAAAHGSFDVAMRTMGERQREHYLAWARRWRGTVGPDMSFADLRVFHLWHGYVDDRHYRGRHDGLNRHGFDPFEDIAHPVDGAWSWNTAKPHLHRYVRSYFAARNEDA